MITTLFALLGLVAAICRLGRASPQIAPLSAVSGIILVLYAAVMLGALEAATTGLFILGVVAFIAEAIFFRSKTILLAPAILVYGIAAVVIWLWLRNASFVSWDDFSHWGLRTKDIVATGSLQTIVMLKEYPPGANLFHYFCLWPIGMSEGGVFVANGWILATPLPMLAGNAVGWRVSISALAGSSILYLCYAVLGVGFVSAQVDTLLMAMFAGALLSYFVAEENCAGYSWLLLPLAALPLIKDSGQAFALIAAAAISADLLFFSSLPLAKNRIVAMAAAMIAFPLSVGKSWQLHVQAEGLQKAFPVEKLSFASVMQDWFYSSSGTTNIIMQNFISALATRDIGLGLPTVGWLCSFGVLWAVLVVAKVQGVGRRRLSSLLVCLSVGLVIYAIGLLVLYTMFFKFGGENVALASFERYVGTYLGAFLIILSFFLLRTSLQGWFLNIVVFAAVVSLISVAKWPILHFPEDEFLLANRGRLDAVRAAVPAGATVQTISQGDDGGQIVRVRYALSPRQYSGNWSLGAPYKTDDPYTRNLSPDELKRSLLRVNFLFLLRVDDNFWKHYASLFADGSPTSGHYLYRVVPTKGGNLELIPTL